MPARYRRSYSSNRGRMARSRVVVSTIENTALASLTVGSTINVDLLTGIAFTSDQEMTVLKASLKLTPTTAPALADTYQAGLIVGRNSDIGLNVAGSISVAQANLPWHAMNGWCFNGGFTVGGGNIIPLRSARSRRVVRGDNSAYILSLSSGATNGAAVIFRLWSRVWVQLP